MKIPSYASAIGAVRSGLTFKPLVYGYSNARVRAMRTGLLTRRQAEDLLKVKTAAAVAEYLSRTQYRDNFAHMPAKITDEERVEIAISRNFAATAQKILRITPEQSKPTLRAFLGRYDIHNLKTILLGKKLGKSSEDISHLLIPAGSITNTELARIVASKNAAELYESVRATPFGNKLFNSASLSRIPKERIRAAISKPGFDGVQTEIILAAADAYYYELASDAAMSGGKDAQEISRLISAEADAKNILTILRMKRGGADKKAILSSMVGGGTFSRIHIEKIAAAKDVNEAAKLASEFFLSSTGRAEFAEAQKLFLQDGRLSHLEVAFENSLARKSLVVLRRSMMSIGAIAGFLFLKEEEMNNIRKIVRGKALGLPPERIAEMLILVG
ncbi:MAG: V-type ATPase subunit [Candidatus Micrarchaeia archaeon]